MPDTQFHGLGTEPTPNSWTIPGSLEILLKAARAVYDGSGAASDFLPALQIISDSGSPVGTYVAGSAVTAGDSADVSFAPFLKGSSSTAPPSTGIQFDVDNVGTWLDIATTGREISTLDGIHLEAGPGAGRLHLLTTGGVFGGGIRIENGGNVLQILHDSVSSSPLVIDTNGADIQIGNSFATSAPSGNVLIGGDPVSIGNGISFFDVAPATQQPTPVTLADVINVLRTFGLCA